MSDEILATHDTNMKLIRKYICELISDNEYLDGSNIVEFNIKSIEENDVKYTQLSVTTKYNELIQFNVRIPDGNISLHYNNVKLISSLKFSIIKSHIRMHLKNIFYYDTNKYKLDTFNK